MMTDNLTPRQEIMHNLLGGELTREEILIRCEANKVGTEEKAPYLKALGNMQTCGDVERRKRPGSGPKTELFRLTRLGLSKASKNGLVCPSCGGPADIFNLDGKCSSCASQDASVVEGEDGATEQADAQPSVVEGEDGATEQADAQPSVVEGEDGATEQADAQPSVVEAIAKTEDEGYGRDPLMLEVINRGMDLRHIPDAEYHARVLRRISEWPALDYGVANWMASLADLLEGKKIEENA